MTAKEMRDAIQRFKELTKPLNESEHIYYMIHPYSWLGRDLAKLRREKKKLDKRKNK